MQPLSHQDTLAQGYGRVGIRGETACCTHSHLIPHLPANFWAQISPTLQSQLFMECCRLARISESPSCNPWWFQQTLKCPNSPKYLDATGFHNQNEVHSPQPTLLRELFIDSIYASRPNRMYSVRVLIPYPLVIAQKSPPTQQQFFSTLKFSQHNMQSRSPWRFVACASKPVIKPADVLKWWITIYILILWNWINQLRFSKWIDFQSILPVWKRHINQQWAKYLVDISASGMTLYFYRKVFKLDWAELICITDWDMEWCEFIFLREFILS